MTEFAISFIVFNLLINIILIIIIYKYCKICNIPYRTQYLRDTLSSIRKSYIRNYNLKIQENRKAKKYRYLYNFIAIIYISIYITFFVWLFFL